MLTIEDRNEIIRGECDTIAAALNQQTLMEENVDGLWTDVPYSVYSERFDMLERCKERAELGLLCWFSDSQIELAWADQLHNKGCLAMVDADVMAEKLIARL